MRASLFGNLRSGANSAVGSPISTPISAGAPLKPSSTEDVEPLSLPPSAAPTTTSTNPPIAAPRARPLTRLTPFGRKSSPSREGLPLGPTPMINATTTPTASPSLPPSSPSLGATGGVSYLDSLGLKLGEAVSKALILPVASSSHPAPSAAGVKVVASAPGASGAKVGAVAGGTSEGPDAVLKGKRPLPAGRGKALGALITSELNHATNVLQDSFLHRAILRLLQRPLTVLTTNLTQQVTQLLLAPEFAPTVPLVLNATHVHALAYAHFASELLETFDVLGLGRRAGAANDGLKPLKEALENVVSKVIGPLVGALKTEVSGVISELEKETPVSPSPLATTGIDQKFDRTVTRVAPLLARVTFSTDGMQTQSTHVQSVLATFEIGVIWGCLVALSNRALPRCSSVKADEDEKVGLRRTMSEGRLRTQPSDSSLSSAESDESAKTDYLGGEKEKGRGMLPSYVTPPDTPQMAPVGGPVKKASTKSTISTAGLSLASLTQRSTPAGSPRAASPKQITPPGSKKLSLVKLPSLKPLSSTTRAPSPPMVKEAAASPSSPLRPHPAAGDAFTQVYKPFVLALHALAREAKTVQMSIKKFRLPVEAGGLARDAVEEALKELNGFVAFLEWLISPDSGSSALLVDARDAEVDVEKVMKITREAPLLLVLPIVLRVALVPIYAKGIDVLQDTVSAWIGLPEDEYRRTCLGGFGKADECASIVGRAVLKNVGARRCFAGWMREWLDRSVKEEEESSSSDEEEDGAGRI